MKSTYAATAALLLLLSCQSTTTQQAPAKKDSVIGVVNPTPAVSEPGTPPLADSVIKCELRKGAILLMNTTYVDTVSYLAFDDNGDDFSFEVTRNNDTAYLICNECRDIALERGDQVRVEWQMNTYVPAGDDSYSYAVPFLKKYQLVKEGKTSQLKKKVKLQLLASASEKNITSYLTDMVHHTVWNYLANTNDATVKQALQNSGTEMEYTITRENDKEDYPYTITISTAGTAATVKELYFDYNNHFILLEKDDSGGFVHAQ
ncbi:hypothetical protein [Filimonas lacunae]|nr:hypothetical protein [Filimonas lacunae]